MSASQGDDINKTFNATTSINVAGITLANCPSTYIYVNSTQQNQYFKEALLMINATETVVYASILESDKMGFNNQTWDFQMLVGENGDVATAVSYYFYVELT